MEADNIRIELEALELVFNDASSEPMKLSYGLLRSITDNFSNEIGCGGFGLVYMGYLRNGKVAVKKFSNPHALPDKQFLSEITCIQKAKHQNIVRFIGYCSEMHGELLVHNGENVMAEVQKKLLCFEYVPNGDIRQYLQQGNTHGDDWSVRYQMIRGICHGLHCLHDKQINHLDLKPENIMLDANMEPKISDFGLSRFLDEGQSKMFTKHIVGTL
ncbi:cysteine-rich receptor-like protein kinase 29 [Triticum dicoccoides]|uniref:cysteine-rich receptor-like protein kinase 29 n=1 Tax=Triticum dicoccoides TaxID=85692 RepID=UPI000E7C78DC|nr:cysteine-rich receptor-like protein kinase 29 [Triticum dicoccoides]